MQVRTKELDAQVRKMHADGIAVAAIACLLKISRPTIYTILSEQHVTA